MRIFKIKPEINTITFIALTDDGDFMGQVNIKVCMNNILRLTGAFVEKEYRRTGVYKTLWEERQKYIERKFKGYEVQAYCNENSVQVFLDNGFEPYETITKLRKYIK